MKNKFEINGDVTKIYLQHRVKGGFIALIDTKDLGIVSGIPNNWFANINYKDKMYVNTTIKGKNIKLHRFLVNCEKGMMVDHINGNPLDNRRENLRIVTASKNQQNRQSAQSNSKSGIRGVSWHQQNKKWVANIRVNRKRIYLGTFENIKDAENAVKEGIAKYMDTEKE